MDTHTLATAIATIIFCLLSNAWIAGFVFLLLVTAIGTAIVDHTGCMRDQHRR